MATNTQLKPEFTPQEIEFLEKNRKVLGFDMHDFIIFTCLPLADLETLGFSLDAAKKRGSEVQA